MAFNITDLTRSVAPSGDYPYGDIQDSSAGTQGTLVNRKAFTDLLQTIQRAMDLAGITPNGLADNVTNTYQVAQALGLEEWVDAGTPTVSVPTGSITVAAGDVLGNRYKLVGKTLHWQINLRTVTISGSPTLIAIEFPTPLLGSTFKTLGKRHTALYNAIVPMSVTESNLSGANKISLGIGGAAFTNGTNDQDFDMDLELELA